MAKIVITIEDKPFGRVCVISDPKLSDLMKRAKGVIPVTSAENYAFIMLNAAREASEAAGQDAVLKLLGSGVGRA